MTRSLRAGIAFASALGMAVGNGMAQIAPVNPAPAPIPMVTPNLANTAASNQAAMSQILGQLNRSQFQLSVAAAETSPVFISRPVVIPGPVRVGK